MRIKAFFASLWVILLLANGCAPQIGSPLPISAPSPRPTRTPTSTPTPSPTPRRSPTPSPSPTAPQATSTNTPGTETSSSPTPVIAATPTPPTNTGPAGLTWVVSGLIVTAMYRDEAGNIYFAGPKTMAGTADPYQAEASVWKKPIDGPPIQLTSWTYNLIGGVLVHNGSIYFSEAGTLRRMPDDNQMHSAQVVLHFPNLSKLTMHINHALAQYTLNGEEVLLMALGSIKDSEWSLPGVHQDLSPPYYEPFPTGRIIYAPFSWLDTTTNYEVVREVPGKLAEFARGVRNTWSIAVGEIDKQTHIFAADNDPSFTPEKFDDDPQNAGDELTEIFFGRNHGHPLFYAGREPEPDYVKPLAVFPDGSVPSGVAVAAGKIFVALITKGMIVEVDPTTGEWWPVITDISTFNLYGYGDLLYIVDWAGIRVVDATGL